MNSRERAREDASKIFTGYVRIGNTDEYIAYEIKGLTKKSVRLRLKKIVRYLSNEEPDVQFTIEHIFDPEEYADEVFRNDHTIVEKRKKVV